MPIIWTNIWSTCSLMAGSNSANIWTNPKKLLLLSWYDQLLLPRNAILCYAKAKLFSNICDMFPTNNFMLFKSFSMLIFVICSLLTTWSPSVWEALWRRPAGPGPSTGLFWRFDVGKFKSQMIPKIENWESSWLWVFSLNKVLKISHKLKQTGPIADLRTCTHMYQGVTRWTR